MACEVEHNHRNDCPSGTQFKETMEHKMSVYKNITQGLTAKY